MPKKNKSVEQHLEAIEFLLAALVLKRDIDIKVAAKILGCSDNILSKLLPKKGKKNEK